MTEPIDDATGITEARSLGEFSGEDFDSHLRSRERAERAELLTRPRNSEPATRQSAGPVYPTDDIAGMKRELELLREFRLTVVRSKGWKVVQALRRLVGRGWIGYD
jgi:hypothetical protein